MDKWRRRSHTVYLILGLCLILELGSLAWNSGICPGLNERADKLKVYAEASRDNATILPGDIYDRNGKALVRTFYEDIDAEDSQGNKSVQTVRKTEYSDGKAYSQVLGYTGDMVLDPLAASAEEVIRGREDYRLMAFLDEEYWGENGLYSTVSPDGTKGQSAVLTIDDAVQARVYEALAGEMDAQEGKSSAVVLDAVSGEILAMTAFPAYDLNDLEQAKADMLADGEEKKELEPAFPVSHKNPETPGSIFKILTAVSLLDHGMEELTVADTPFYVNDWLCTNAYYSAGDTIGYADAIERSSNVFFARAALELGRERLNETAEKFMLTGGMDGQEGVGLSLDFGNVPCRWDLDVKEDVFAQTGFGQGRTELTAIHAAMITQAIANDGTMMKPYLIKSLQDAEGTTVYEGAPAVLSEATGKETADKVTQAMTAAAIHTCTSYPGFEETLDVFSRYQVAGKTGTAETGDSQETNNAWFISFAPADDPQYVVVINQCRCHKGGYEMAPAAAEIYEYLFEQYQ